MVSFMTTKNTNSALPTISTDLLAAICGGQDQGARQSLDASAAACAIPRPLGAYVPLWQIPGDDYVPYQG
jgi:hypothetical protein